MKKNYEIVKNYIWDEDDNMYKLNIKIINKENNKIIVDDTPTDFKKTKYWNNIVKELKSFIPIIDEVWYKIKMISKDWSIRHNKMVVFLNHYFN